MIMGTNVYLMKPLKKEDKNKLINKIKNCLYYEDVLNEVERILQPRYEYETGDSFYKIHIGKRSSGWKFLFSRNLNKYCLLDRDNITNWLKTGDIVNEYGERISLEKFWKEYVDDFADGMTCEDYYKKHPEERRYLGNYGDIMINGLRFTKDYSCFS